MYTASSLGSNRNDVAAIPRRRQPLLHQESRVAPVLDIPLEGPLFYVCFDTKQALWYGRRIGLGVYRGPCMPPLSGASSLRRSRTN